MKKYCIILFALILFVNCRKRGLLPTNDNNKNSFELSPENVRMSDDVRFCQESDLIYDTMGMLVFPNVNVFKSVVEDIEVKNKNHQQATDNDEKDDKIFIKFEKMFNYTSLRKRIENERNVWLNAGELDFNNDPDDKWFEGDAIRTVLNDNGSVKIGDSIFVCMPFGDIYVIRNGNFNTYLNILSSSGIGNFQNTILIKNDGAEYDAFNGNILKNASDCKNNLSKSISMQNNSNTRQLKGKVWIWKFTTLLSSVGSESEHFKKKNNGGWKKEKADIIKTTSSGIVFDNECRVGSPLSIPMKTKTNAKDVSHAYFYWNNPIKGKKGLYSSYHYSKDGNTAPIQFTLAL